MSWINGSGAAKRVKLRLMAPVRLISTLGQLFYAWPVFAHIANLRTGRKYYFDRHSLTAPTRQDMTKHTIFWSPLES